MAIGGEICAQVDTLFWFAVPDFTHGHGDEPVFFRFSTLNEAADIVVSQPANPNFVPINLTVSANSARSINVSSIKGSLENDQPVSVLNRGIRIVSTTPVNVYYENASRFNPEIFSLKGAKALGQTFLVPMQNLLPNGNYDPTPYASFDIVATEDSTIVRIDPSHDIVGQPAGQPFEIRLNKGQTYSARASTTSPGRHLGGTFVRSNRPIAITIKDDSMSAHGVYGRCSDLGGDQITPIDYLGQQYISIPGALTSPNDAVFIYAIQDNTEIEINGQPSAVLDKGNFFQAFSYGQPLIIEASLPVYVLHMSGFGCEVGLDQLPPVNPCNGSTILAVSRSSNQPFFLNILVYRDLEDGFRFNGRADVITTSDLSDVPGSGGEWKFGRVEISLADLAVNTSAIIQNAKGPFHLSVIHGGPQTGTMYGYFSDYGIIDLLPRVEVSCSDGLLLELDTTYTSYLWSTGDTTSSLLVQESGTYAVTVVSASGCIASDTMSVEVYPEARSEHFLSLCPGDSLFAGGQWFHAGRRSGEIVLPLASEKGCDSIVDVNLSFYPDNPGLIKLEACHEDTLHLLGQTLYRGREKARVVLEGASAHGCDSTVKIEVVFHPLPRQELFLDLCMEDTVLIHGSTFHHGSRSKVITLTGASYRGCDSIIDVKIRALPEAINYINSTICSTDTLEILGVQFHAQHANGEIRLERASGYGCDSLIIVDLDVRQASVFHISDTLCPGESVRVNGELFDETNRSGRFVMPSANAEGCDSTILIDLFFPDNYLWLQDTLHINYGDSILLKPDYRYDFTAWEWRPDTTLSCLNCERPVAKPLSNTIYRLLTVDRFGCVYHADIEIFIRLIRKVFAPNVITVNGDGINDGFILFGNYMAERIENLEIYDRWGELVWSGKNLPFNNERAGWDGTMNGTNVLPGTYVFKAEIVFRDGKREQVAGDVTVVR